MSNQYIVTFSNNLNQCVSSYVDLYKTDYDIPVLHIQTCEDKTDNVNKILFHQFITNSFGKVEFDDKELKFTLTLQDIENSIIFDKNSSCAYSKFKNHKSGNVLYVGQVLYIEEKRIPHGNGIMYYDLPDHKVKYSGEFENGTFDGAGLFYNKTGVISLKVNNISNGIPTQKGKLYLNFKNKNETYDIDFFNIWDEIDVIDNKSKVDLVMSDEFLNTLAEYLCDFEDKTFDELMFNEKSLDDKLDQIWDILCTINDNQNTHYNEIKIELNTCTCIQLIFNFIVCITIVILVNLLI